MTLNLRELEEKREKAAPGEWVSARAQDTASMNPVAPCSYWVDGAGPRRVAVDRSVCIHADDMDYIAALHNAAPELFAAKRRLEALSKAIAHVALHGNEGAAIAVADILSHADQIEKERSK